MMPKMFVMPTSTFLRMFQNLESKKSLKKIKLIFFTDLPIPFRQRKIAIFNPFPF
jgi:hypothetical protein